MRTYVWWNYDAWGNESEGREVNDRFSSGYACDLRGDETDEEIILACELDPTEYELDGNSDPDFSIEVVRKEDGKPLGQLVPEPVKVCKICGDEIINGENGCSMYAECNRCRPIRYFAKPRQGVPYSEEDALALESRCIKDCEDL